MIDKATDEELKDLRDEVRDLRKFKAAVERQDTRRGKVTTMLVHLWAGPGVTDAFRNWVAFRPIKNGLAPISETADLAAAIVKRIIRVGVITAMLAIIPSALLFWQNLIMKNQNQSLILQIEEQRRATSTQQVTEYFSQLLSSSEADRMAALSYFATETSLRDEAMKRLSHLISLGHSDSKCASLKALTSLLRSENKTVRKSLYEVLVVGQQAHASSEVDNTKAFLRNIDCEGLDFSELNLGGPILFNGVTFDKSTFEDADVSNVSIIRSSLRGAKFYNGTRICDSESSNCLRLRNVDFTSGVFLVRPQIQPKETSFSMFNVDFHKAIMGIKEAELYLMNDRERYRAVGSAVCLPFSVANDCYEYHYANDITKLNMPKPNSCPNEVHGPMIMYQENEWQQCKGLIDRGKNIKRDFEKD